MSFESRKNARREARNAIVVAEATQGAGIAFLLLGFILAWFQGWPAFVVCAILALAVQGLRPPPPDDIDKRMSD